MELNLLKENLPQLKELLERQNRLLRNKKLLEKLKDRGDSVKKLHNQIQSEIKHREDIHKLEEGFSSLKLSTSNSSNEFLSEKHIEYVCSKEKPMEDSRYRPHRTLIHREMHKSVSDKPAKDFVEITSAFEPKLQYEPTKFIPLAESLVIENEQAIRVMDEHARRTLNNLNELAIDSEGEDDKEQNDLHNEESEKED